MTTKNLIAELLDYLFPNLCPGCNHEIVDLNSLCNVCWSKLNFITSPICITCGKGLPFEVEENSSCFACVKDPPKYNLARASLKFDAQSKKLVHYFKYYDKTRLADVFAKVMYTMYKKEISNFDCIVPVPMHKLKRMIRFYNQAFVLGQKLSQISEKPIISDVLYKVKWTKSQALLSGKARKQNVSNSFAVLNSIKIKDKKVILIDDVSTTRSTVNACAQELRKSASKVFVLCIAAT